jgi:hypothetical protein
LRTTPITPQKQLESPKSRRGLEAKTLQKAAVKYAAVNIAKHIPQIHKTAPAFDKGAAAIMKTGRNKTEEALPPHNKPHGSPLRPTHAPKAGPNSTT